MSMTLRAYRRRRWWRALVGIKPVTITVRDVHNSWSAQGWTTEQAWASVRTFARLFDGLALPVNHPWGSRSMPVVVPQTMSWDPQVTPRT